MCPPRRPAVSLRWVSEMFSLWAPRETRGRTRDLPRETSKFTRESHRRTLCGRSNHPEQAWHPFCERPGRTYFRVSVAPLDICKWRGVAIQEDCVWMPKFEFHIILMYHKIILPLIFFPPQPFKNLSVQAEQELLWPRSGPRAGLC